MILPHKVSAVWADGAYRINSSHQIIQVGGLHFFQPFDNYHCIDMFYFTKRDWLTECGTTDSK